jgi:Fe-S cluster biogenesis protein NfuA
MSELSPNPASTVFWVDKGVDILGKGAKSIAYENRYSCQNSPLASAIFKITGVESVMLSASTITVTKKKEFDWQVVKPSVELVLSQFIDSGIPIVRPGTVEMVTPVPQSTSAESSIEDRIRALIAERVQPFVAQDGGDIEYLSFDEESGVVRVRMHGACKGCPKSMITLKMGIERMLKHYIPEVVGVVNEESSEPATPSEEEKVFGP